MTTHETIPICLTLMSFANLHLRRGSRDPAVLFSVPTLAVLQILDAQNILLPLLQVSMFNPCPLQHALDLAELFKCIRLGKCKVVFHLVPPGKEDELLVFALLVDPPSASVCQWGCIRPETRRGGLEDAIELGLFALFDEVPAHRDDGCIERNSRCRRLRC